MHKSKQELLESWHMGLRVLHRGNFMAAKHYSRLNILLGVPVVMVTSIAGSTMFATSGESDALALQYAAGALAILATVLSSLQTFLSYGEQAAKHKEAAVKYGTLRTELQVMLTSDIAALPDLDARIESLRVRWAGIDAESPTLPKKIYDNTRRWAEASG
jgi:hypothetical protein